MLASIFSVTNTAIDAAKLRLEKRGTPNASVRLGVKGGGCSGYSYVVKYDDDAPAETDLVIETNGAKFLIDNKSLPILQGATLDYVKSLMYEGFKFINPLEASTCGCGTSFTITNTITVTK